MEINKSTKFTLSLETIISIGVTIFMVVGLWFKLQADIEEAKLLPEPPISRTEYDLKDQMIRNSILNTEEKVEKLKEFYQNLASYCIVIPFLIFINLRFSSGFHWFWFPIFGWGIGLTFHFLEVNNYNIFLGKNWEDRKIKEMMKDDKNNKYN